MARILVVEDEPSIQSILRELLTDAGHRVFTAGDGSEGLALFHKMPFDLVLLDILLPQLDGYAVCRRIRESSEIPIIMLTALDGEAAQIKAFELRVDDYITKPFSVKLALLRVEAVLRRSRESVQVPATLQHWGIALDPVGMEVQVRGRKVSLTPTEFSLLKVFLEQPGRVFTRDNLLNLVWGYDFVGDEKTVNIHIMNLRHKLGIDCIETVRGVGYRLAKED